MDMCKLRVSALLLAVLMSPASIIAGEEDIPSVNAEQVTVSGIRLDSSEREIVKILGVAGRIESHGLSEIVEGEARTFHYDGLKIYLIGREIFGLECRGGACVTDKGIRIGDDRNKVEGAYGPSSGYEKDVGRLGYVFKKIMYMSKAPLFFSSKTISFPK